jgi:hypothetical protein
MRTIPIALMMTLATQAGAQETRAQIKCFANLTQHLFTLEMQESNKKLERDRQRHLELAVDAGRKEFPHGHKFGVDFYLGGYVERVFEGQMAKLKCNDANNFMNYCETWISSDIKVLSKIGMDFYRRENCALLLK